MLASLNPRFGHMKSPLLTQAKKVFISQCQLSQRHSFVGWRSLLEDLNLDRIGFETTT
jgi:hypothetical protein